MPNNTQPDYIALAMVAAMIIIVVIMVIRKWRSDHKAVSSETQVQEVAAPAQATGTAGKIKLNGVAPKTAAMLMAIVADQLDKPLNELRFISIREVKE